jgi:uncharacterized Tic20 family protein
MRPSADPELEPKPVPQPEQAPPGQGLAIVAESLYLANLLLLPGISFLLLVYLALRADSDSPPLAKAHLGQTVTASLWAGALLVIVNALIVLLGGYTGAHTWVLVIIYFTVCHSTLVLLGVVGLSKAMAGQCWRYPLIGRPLPSECPGTTAHD